MKMDKKMQACFTPHVMMHSLFGLGLGVFIVSLFPGLAMWWLGVLVMGIATVFDVRRK